MCGWSSENLLRAIGDGGAVRSHFVCVSGTAGEAGADVRLLSHDLGDDPAGRHSVTVRHALESAGLDPLKAARRLVALPPDVARADLAAVLRAFRIGGHPCPDPDAHAMAALRRAGAEFLPHPFEDARWRPLAAGLVAAAVLALLLL